MLGRSINPSVEAFNNCLTTKDEFSPVKIDTLAIQTPDMKTAIFNFEQS
jgi:hypothetical protein